MSEDFWWKLFSLNLDFIGIDCGVSEDYMDEVTGLWYQTDKNFVETGINHAVVSDTFSNPFHGPLKTVRRFPEGNRSCYTLKPKQGKNSTWLQHPSYVFISKLRLQIKLQVLICTLEPTTGLQLIWIMQPKWEIMLWFTIPQQTSYKFVL